MATDPEHVVPSTDQSTASSDDERFSVGQDNQFGIVPRSVAFSTMSIGAKALYGLLAQYAGASETAWPSRQTLADKLSVSTRTITNYVRELTDAGFVRVTPRTDNRGAQIGNYYFLGSMLHRPAGEGGGNTLPPRGGNTLPGGWKPASTRKRTYEREPLKKGEQSPKKNYDQWIELVREEMTDESD